MLHTAVNSIEVECPPLPSSLPSQIVLHAAPCTLQSTALRSPTPPPLTNECHPPSHISFLGMGHASPAVLWVRLYLCTLPYLRSAAIRRVCRLHITHCAHTTSCSSCNYYCGNHEEEEEGSRGPGQPDVTANGLFLFIEACSRSINNELRLLILRTGCLNGLRVRTVSNIWLWWLTAAPESSSPSASSTLTGESPNAHAAYAPCNKMLLTPFAHACLDAALLLQAVGGAHTEVNL